MNSAIAFNLYPNKLMQQKQASNLKATPLNYSDEREVWL